MDEQEDTPDDIARQRALDRQREKEARAKARKARNARRKLQRLRDTLKDTDDLTDWEDEFSVSVSERLDTYGAAFQDREKGDASDALSYAQKKIISRLNAKVKAAKKETQKPGRSPRLKSKSGFKSRSGFTPRVRHIEDDMPEDDASAETPMKEDPYIPEYRPDKPSAESPPKRPFLRIVKNTDET